MQKNLLVLLIVCSALQRSAAQICSIRDWNTAEVKCANKCPKCFKYKKCRMLRKEYCGSAKRRRAQTDDGKFNIDTFLENEKPKPNIGSIDEENRGPGNEIILSDAFPESEPNDGFTGSPTRWPTFINIGSESEFGEGEGSSGRWKACAGTPLCTNKPTKQPTKNPTKQSTLKPTLTPTVKPSKNPTFAPSFNPTRKPTNNPTYAPTNVNVCPRYVHVAPFHP